MLVLPLGIKESHIDVLEGGRRGGLFVKRGPSVLSPNPAVREPRVGTFFPVRSTPAEMEGLYRLPKHSERLALVQGGPQRGPGYMASGLGGSLKSLAAVMSFLMCLSSVMPAS